jgi:hypothetical protein
VCLNAAARMSVAFCSGRSRRFIRLLSSTAVLGMGGSSCTHKKGTRFRRTSPAGAGLLVPARGLRWCNPKPRRRRSSAFVMCPLLSSSSASPSSARRDKSPPAAQSRAAMSSGI